MERRQFLTAASAAAIALTLPKSAARAAADAAPGGRQFIELRTYRFASGEKQQAYAKLLADAGVAAFNRAGARNVGVFQLLKADNPKLNLAEDPAEIWLVLPHTSFDSFLAFESHLAADTAYQEAGKAILSAPKSDPAFVRYDSHLLLSFEGHPRLTPPADRSDKSVYELRTYESPNQERAANKVAMFNGGEIPIFARSGMPGVFFGSAVAGNDLPHLTYMVHHGADDPKKHWSAFGSDAEWIQMKNDPQYKDNVSKITNRFIRPLPGSQL